MSNTKLAIRILLGLIIIVIVICVQDDDDDEGVFSHQSAALDYQPLPLSCNYIDTGVTRTLLSCRGSFSDVENSSNATYNQIFRLDLINCQFDELRKHIFAQFPKLIRLNVECQYTGLGELYIEEGTLAQMPDLAILTIASGRLRSIAPRGIFCELARLGQLTLSHNNLVDLTTIGLPSECRMSQSSVNSTECKLKALTILTLSHNSFRRVGNDAFACHHLESLVILDISSNRLESIEPGAFSRLKNLQLLDLADNRLQRLDANVFVGLDRLWSLFLSGNHLESEQTANMMDTLRHTRNLSHLIVNDNNLTHVDQGLFTNFARVTVLDLSGNQIGRLTANAFTGNVRMTNLTVDKNRLHSVDDDFLGISSASALTQLRLTDNRLSSVRFLRKPDGACQRLQYLHLSDNLINELGHDLDNCRQLIELHLDGNRLMGLFGANDRSLANLGRLRLLNLARNTIMSLGDSHAFRDLRSLTEMRLEFNLLGYLPRSVAAKFDADGDGHGRVKNYIGLNIIQLANLTRLNLSHNHIEDYFIGFGERSDDNNGLLPKLDDLDLSHNRIDYFGVNPQLGLRRLDVSFNRLRGYKFEAYVPESIEELLLNDNRIDTVNPNGFTRLLKIKRIHLHNNNLTTLLRLRFDDENRATKLVTLRGNPWHCDCRLKWLADMAIDLRDGSRRDAIDAMTIADYDQLTCDREFDGNRANLDDHHLTSRQMRIVDADKDKESLMCQFNSCTSCPTPCPPACSCYRNWNWSVVSVDCSSRRLDKISDVVVDMDDDANRTMSSNVSLPLSTTNLYLNDNNISSIGATDFHGLRLIETLDVSGNRVEDVAPRTFDAMSALTELQLADNRIRRLPVDLFANNCGRTLLTLNLSHNLLETLHDGRLLSPLIRLRSLDLRHNRLATPPVWQIFSGHNFPAMNWLDLRQNPFSCGCDYATRFADWLTKSRTIEMVPNREDIECTDQYDLDQDQDQDQDQDVVKTSLLAFNASHCYVRSQLVMATDAFMSLPIVLAAVSFFALLVSTIVLVSVYRWELQVLLYHHYGVRIFHGGNDDDDDDLDADDERSKTFDAFVAYASADEDFLIEDILPPLENAEPPYVLCLHQKNFLAGAYIVDNILESIERSRRTIVLLTPNFVRSEWGRFEFRTAHMQMLKDRRRRLIVIVNGQIPLDEIDDEMRLYLKTNTYLTWGERFFWKKLYFAMPDKCSKKQSRQH